MEWTLEEAVSHYERQGAPGDQTALVGLLREVQQENNGSIPEFLLDQIAQAYNIKKTFLLAIVKRIPSLRLDDTHILELCAGPNCGKHLSLAAYAEELHSACGKKFVLKFSPCMRMCGKGPNIKWDGKIYHQANPLLLQQLLAEAGIVF